MMMPEELSVAEYQSLLDNSQPLVSNKIFLTENQEILKIFRHKKKFSTEFLHPYALRFQENAAQLRKREIPTIEVDKVYYQPHEKQYLVRYRLLEGTSIRELLQQGEKREKLLPLVASLLAQMHQRGVYFRGCHLGNILLLKDGRLGVIDISDVQFSRSSLDTWRRARNFKVFMRYPEDQSEIFQWGLDKFIQHYLQQAALSPFKQWAFWVFLLLYNPKIRKAYLAD